MRSFRTSFVVAAAVAALSWSGVSRADDDVNSKKGTTTKTQSSGSTTKSGSATTDPSTSSAPSSGTDITSDTPGPNPTPSTGTGASTDTWGTDTSGTGASTGTTGTGTGSSATGPGSTYTVAPGVTDTTTAQPNYDMQQPPVQTTTTYSTTTTTSADYDERAGAESTGYIYRPNRPMLATGLGIFGASYGASVIVGAASDLNEDKRLFIPVVGPWLDMGERPCGLGDCSTREDFHNVLLIGSGIAQGVGIGLTIASLFVPEEREVKRSAASAHARSVAASKPTVKVLPVNVRGGGGLGAFGTF